MNKRSVSKKRPVKASRSTAVRKSPRQPVAARKTVARSAARKPQPVTAAKNGAVRNGALKNGAVKTAAVKIAAVEKNGAVKNGAVKTGFVKNGAVKNGAIKTAAVEMATVTVEQVTALSPPLRSHRFRVGQTVFYTSSPISRPGATGSYEVVRLLPSDGDDYQYRIKNPGEAFERVAKESQLEIEH
jgi:hypothetical protein